MPYKEGLAQSPRLKVVNSIDAGITIDSIPFSTGNQNKADELGSYLGIQLEAKNLKPNEIQVKDPVQDWELNVDFKAIDAFERNGGSPALVEDAMLFIDDLGGLPGIYADAFLSERSMREKIAGMVSQTNRGATFRVCYSVYDGVQVRKWWHDAKGELAPELRGGGWGFDDMFIDYAQQDVEGFDGKLRTYGEMSSDEKEAISPRSRALDVFIEHPPSFDIPIFELPGPYQMQLERIRKERLAENPLAMQVAYDLDMLDDKTPRSDFSVPERKKLQIQKYANGEVIRVVHDVNSPDLGVLLGPWNIKRTHRGEPVNLKLTDADLPYFWTLHEDSISMALASRAQEIARVHNPENYTRLRAMLEPNYQTIERPNVRSQVIEDIIGVTRMIEQAQPDMPPEKVWELALKELGVAHTGATVQDIGYSRESSTGKLSRRAAAHLGFMVKEGRQLTSLIKRGAMPPTASSVDTIVMSAMMLEQIGVSRSSFYSNPRNAVMMLAKVGERIRSYNLPPDIEQLVFDQVEISLPVDNPREAMAMMSVAGRLGFRSGRFYSTSPGNSPDDEKGNIDTPKRVRDMKGGDNFLLSYYHAVDLPHALALVGPDVQMDEIALGHALGENCTSLTGGGASTSLEIFYAMTQLPQFNKTRIGFEGGVGSSIGPILPWVSFICKNRGLTGPTVESGGVMVELTDKKKMVGTPYPGSAGAGTKMLDVVFNPELADKRYDDAGYLPNVEGVSDNYAFWVRLASSIAISSKTLRDQIATAITDQGAMTIDDLRRKFKERGKVDNHRVLTSSSARLISPHKN